MALKKIEFLSGLAIGDSLMVTSAVRDLKKAYPEYAIRVRTTSQHIWDYNPYLSDFDGRATITVELGPKKFVKGSQTSGLHYTNAFRKSMEENLNIRIPQGHIKPDLHLSEDEKNDRIINGRYWIIVPGGKEDFGTKIWPPERWQEVIDSFPELTFVQIGENRTLPDGTKIWSPPLTGDNLINLVDQTAHPDTGIRDLIKLFYHCDGSIGHVSMQMHLAAAFDKACVTVAGAREPASFEQYNHQRYLHNQGSLRCKNDCHNCLKYSEKREKKKKHVYCGGSPMDPNFMKDKILCEEYSPIDPTKIYIKACWKSAAQACTNKVAAYGKDYPKCLMMIETRDVVNAIRSYYEGGALGSEFYPASLNKKRIKAPTRRLRVVKNKPIFKMVCNAQHYIGGEKSVCWITSHMEKKGYHVQLVPSGNKVCDTFRKNMGENVEITNNITDSCDILMVYSNDMAYRFQKEPYKVMEKVKANKKILMLNYKLGGAGKAEWTKTWDLYGFLSSQMRDEFLKRVPGVRSFVLPPAVDIEPYLRENVRYNKTLHLVRHSSQGDNKYAEDTNETMTDIRKAKPQAEFSFMPPPSFLDGGPRIHSFGFNEIPVVEFLKRGNLYWYQLPEKYSDQGPRTIVEAMALGLPCIADRRWGAKDRITEETGWLCDKPEDYAEIIGGLNHKILQEKGAASKERARECFDPQNWIKTIIG